MEHVQLPENASREQVRDALQHLMSTKGVIILATDSEPTSIQTYYARVPNESVVTRVNFTISNNTRFEELIKYINSVYVILSKHYSILKVRSIFEEVGIRQI